MLVINYEIRCLCNMFMSLSPFLLTEVNHRIKLHFHVNMSKEEQNILYTESSRKTDFFFILSCDIKTVIRSVSHMSWAWGSTLTEWVWQCHWSQVINYALRKLFFVVTSCPSPLIIHSLLKHPIFGHLLPL